jgi:hypothetical protein
MRVCHLQLSRAACRQLLAPVLMTVGVFGCSMMQASMHVSHVPHLVTTEDTPAMPVPIRIEAADPGSIALSIRSANPSLVPESNAAFSGAGAERTLVVTPASNESGQAFLELRAITDSMCVTQAFTVTVNAVNDAPTMSPISDQVIPEDATALVLSLSIGDVETPAASLSVTCTSLDPELIPNDAITVAGGGSRRSVTLKPRPGRSGVARVQVNVSDGEAGTAQEFEVSVGRVNRVPLVNAGPDQTLLLTNATMLNGSATDEEMDSVRVRWSQVAGPSDVEFANASALNTMVRFGSPGVYTFRLTASDDTLTASDDVRIVVGQTMARTEGKRRKNR